MMGLDNVHIVSYDQTGGITALHVDMRQPPTPSIIKRRFRWRFGRAAVVFRAIVAALLALLASCAHTPEVSSGKVVNCASKAVGENWTRAYPEVMKCLTVVSVSPVACLDAVPSVVKTGIDVVACIVRDTAKSAGMQAQAEGADVVTVRKAERSREYLDVRAFEFVE